jgi:disulfide bond formation protein DsbB
MSGTPLTARRSANALPRRPINFAGFLICAALIGYALYAQFKLGLDPCPLCIFQRIGIVALGVVFLIAAPSPPSPPWRLPRASFISNTCRREPFLPAARRCP